MKTVVLILVSFAVAAYAKEENYTEESKKDQEREKRHGWGPEVGAASQRGSNWDDPSGPGSPHAGAAGWNSGSNAPVASSVNYQIDHISAPTIWGVRSQSSGWQQGGGAAPWNAGWRSNGNYNDWNNRWNTGRNNGWNNGWNNAGNNGWNNAGNNGWNSGWNSGSNGGWNGVNGGGLESGLSSHGYSGAWNNRVNIPRGPDPHGPSNNGWSSYQRPNNW